MTRQEKIDAALLRWRLAGKEEIEGGQYSNRTREGLWFFGHSGNGDVLHNTCFELIDRGIDDRDAHRVLGKVFDLCIWGKRWPDDIAHRITTTNHKQTDMTQECWIAAYCLAVHLNDTDYIELWKPKFYNKGWHSGFLWTPEKVAWRRALLGKRNLYPMWKRIMRLIPKQDYVEALYWRMEQAYETVKQ